MSKFNTLRSKFVASALVIVLVVTLAICALIYYVVGGMLNQSVFDNIESSTLNLRDIAGATVLGNVTKLRKSYTQRHCGLDPQSPEIG